MSYCWGHASTETAVFCQIGSGTEEKQSFSKARISLTDRLQQQSQRVASYSFMPAPDRMPHSTLSFAAFK